jgi:hypothetical protein
MLPSLSAIYCSPICGAPTTSKKGSPIPGEQPELLRGCRGTEKDKHIPPNPDIDDHNNHNNINFFAQQQQQFANKFKSSGESEYAILFLTFSFLQYIFPISVERGGEGGAGGGGGANVFIIDRRLARGHAEIDDKQPSSIATAANSLNSHAHGWTWTAFQIASICKQK